MFLSKEVFLQVCYHLLSSSGYTMEGYLKNVFWFLQNNLLSFSVLFYLRSMFISVQKMFFFLCIQHQVLPIPLVQKSLIFVWITEAIFVSIYRSPNFQSLYYGNFAWCWITMSTTSVYSNLSHARAVSYTHLTLPTICSV